MGFVEVNLFFLIVRRIVECRSGRIWYININIFILIRRKKLRFESKKE